MTVWSNPEAMDLLRARAEAGDSSGQIVAALAAQGFVVSRSAVIGKLMRAGIPLKGAATRAAARQCEEAMAVARPSPNVAPVAAARVASVTLAGPGAAGWPRPRGKVMPFSSSAAVHPDRRAEGRSATSPSPAGEVAAVPPPALEAGGVPLIGLPADRCRWPVSGAGAGLLVCGAFADHRAYCRAHGHLAYQPLTTPLRPPADPTVRPVRSRERERSFMDAYGEAV